jgi:hypothetical protein
MKKSNLFILPLLLVISLTVVSSRPQEDASLDFSILEEGPGAAVVDMRPGLTVFTDEGEYTDYYKRIHRAKHPKPSPPIVDFNKDIAVFITFGEQKSAGYFIEIRKVYIRGSTLVIKAILITPPQDSFQAQVITHPYNLIVLPVGDYKRIELVDEIGEVQDFMIPG